MRRSLLLKLIAIVIVLTILIGAGIHIYRLSGDSFDFSDTETRVVISGSMDGEPRTGYDIETIPTGSMVFIQKVPKGPYAYEFYSSLQIGDVVTFHYKHPITRENMVVTHRIIDISDSSGDIKFTMAGDSIQDDPTNSSKQVVYASSGDMIGKVTGVSPLLGDISVFLSSANGKAVLLGTFASIIFLIWFGPNLYRNIIRKINKRKECD